MNNNNIYLIVMIILAAYTVSFSQSIYHVEGDYLYIYHDRYSSTKYYTFDPIVDRGRIGSFYCGYLNNKYNDRDFDSLFIDATKYYSNKEFNKAKDILNTLIGYIGTEKEPLIVDLNVRGRERYTMYDVYKLLRVIYFEEKDFITAIEINNDFHKYREKYLIGEDLLAVLYNALLDINRFNAQCFYELNKYDTVIVSSSRYMNDSVMVALFVNSLFKKFDKNEIREKLNQETENLDLTKNWFETFNDSSKKFMIGYSEYFTLSIKENKIRLIIPEAKAIGNDYANKQITKEEANLRLKEAFRNHLLYKLIIKE